jgi:predicted dehydrogenase
MNISGQGCHRLKRALVGFGYIMEKGHSPAYRVLAVTVGDVEIMAIADICQARRERALERFPNARIYDNHRALLECEMAKLAFVDVATPPCDHAAVAMDALDAGVHVFCEKPLAWSTDQATAMLHRAVRAGRMIFPCHTSTATSTSRSSRPCAS